MLKLQFASLSMGASVDQQTGSLSVFDVVEEIRTPQVPIQLQSMVISVSLEKQIKEKFDGKLFIHLFTPDGTQRVVGTGEMAIPAEQRRMKAVFRFASFPVLAFGSHRFVMSWVNSAGQKIGEAILDFSVVQVTQVANALEQGEKPPVQHYFWAGAQNFRSTAWVQWTPIAREVRLSEHRRAGAQFFTRAVCSKQCGSSIRQVLQ